MGTVTGLTAARMLVIEAMSVVSGLIRNDNLVLVRRDGTEIVAGNVRGPQGPQGVPGSITTSPAGGVLSGNYPNPGLAVAVITDTNVAVANKDGAVTVPSMRTLGTGPAQAAAGDHNHSDTGWVDFTLGAGDTPLGLGATTGRAQYRKRGSLVHVRISKTLGSSRDMSSSTSGNFGNVNIGSVNALPAVARPKDQSVRGIADIDNTPISVLIGVGGTLVWTGGFPRNYPAGGVLSADFVYYTDS